MKETVGSIGFAPGTAREKWRPAVTIKAEHYRFTEEICQDYFKCPMCKFPNLVEGWKHCPRCGTDLQWDVERDGFGEIKKRGRGHDAEEG